MQTATQLVFMYRPTCLLWSIIIVIPAKGKTSGILECGTWSSVYLVGGRWSKEALKLFTFSFCTIIFCARCLYMIRDHFIQPRPSTRNREATKTRRQEYITSKQRSSSVFSIHLQGHLTTTSYACIGTALDFAGSTPSSAAHISTR